MSEYIFIVVQLAFDIIIVLYLIWDRYSSSNINNSYNALISSIKDLLVTQKEMIEEANTKITSQQASITKVLDDVRQKNTVLSELIRSVKISTFEDATKNKIFNMIKNNFSIEEISKQLNIPKGEIELVVKLYKEDL